MDALRSSTNGVQNDTSLQVVQRENSKLNVPDDQVSAIAKQLSPEETSRCDAAMIRRYVRACAGDSKQALRRLHETLAWRASEQPEQLYCRACAKEPKSHYMQVVAWDKGRRPTIYSCLSIPVSHSMEEGREHMVSVFEQAIAMMPPGVEDWVWVLDMHGFGLRDVDPRLAFAFLKISASHYPERLAQAYVVSAPRIFTGFWATISPFIDPKTKAKIHFGNFHKNGKNDQLRAALALNLDGLTVEWLMQEMEENRVKNVARRKQYCCPDLVALASSPSSPEVTASAARRMSQSHSGRHDFLGAPPFLASMSGSTELLAPCITAVAAANRGMPTGGRAALPVNRHLHRRSGGPEALTASLQAG